MVARRIRVGIEAPPPSGSGWGDHGTFLDLSTTTVTDDTVTSHDTGGFSTVRGTQARGTTGLWYFEVKLLDAPAADALFIGLLDSNVATGASMDTQTLAHGCRTYCNDGTAATADGGFGIAVVNVGSAVSLADNDVLGIAFDATNGFHYFSVNGTYKLSGNPASGVSGTGHIGAYTGTASGTSFYPSVSIWGLVNATCQLITGAGALANLPSGYTAWG